MAMLLHCFVACSIEKPMAGELIREMKKLRLAPFKDMFILVLKEKEIFLL